MSSCRAALRPARGKPKQDAETQLDTLWEGEDCSFTIPSRSHDVADCSTMVRRTVVLADKAPCFELPFEDPKRSRKFAGPTCKPITVQMLQREPQKPRHLHLLGFPVWGDRSRLSCFFPACANGSRCRWTLQKMRGDRHLSI